MPMPKAAAIQPLEWATIHSGMGTFDIGELNRVVIDYGYIELQAAKRWTRRTALGRFCNGLLQCFKVIGLMAAVLLATITMTGTDDEVLFPIVYASAGLSCVAMLGWYVPWALTPYRQWDRTLSGIAVMMIVAASVSTVSLFAWDLETGPVWLLAGPCVALLLVSVWALVGAHRFRNREKPPAIDPATLTPEEMDVLFALRRRTLKVLRGRNVVAYKDFNGFDRSPLVPTATSD